MVEFILKCSKVSSDILMLRVDETEGCRLWFDVNTNYPNTRITITPTLGEMVAFHAALGQAIDAAINKGDEL